MCFTIMKFVNNKIKSVNSNKKNVCFLLGFRGILKNKNILKKITCVIENTIQSTNIS